MGVDYDGVARGAMSGVLGLGVFKSTREVPSIGQINGERWVDIVYGGDGC